MVARTSILLLLCACASAPAPAPAAPAPTLEAHARAHDDEGLHEAAAALKAASAAERMTALAALLEYDASKLQPLEAALADRASHAPTEPEKSAAAWVLVHAGDAAAIPAALALYASGGLERVKNRGGTPAFDPVELARLVAAHPAPSSLAAARRNALVTALPSADASTRPALVRAILADADDGATLVAVARMLDPQTDFGVLEQVFRRVLVLMDPRAADSLASYADHATHPHFRTLAALALASLGDVRAAPHLAWRIGQDPSSADDGERAYCARRMSDLAEMHPEARTQLREMAEAPTLAWFQKVPSPSALRLLVDVESPKALPLLRDLADPKAPIPPRGAEALPDAFVLAQPALRMLGRTHDASARAILEKQLGRKPPAFDDATDAIAQSPNAGAGLAYRALEVGAADGLMEDADPKAVPLLVKLAEDPKANELARFEACKAVAWLADAATRRDVIAKLRATATDRKKELFATCWLTGLTERSMPAVDGVLLGLLAAKTPPRTRHLVARLLGQDGLSPSDRPKVEALLADPAVVHDAALALLLGGNAASVAKALAAYEPKDDDSAAPSIEALRQLYARSVAALGEDLVASGALARMASLALAARNVTVRGAKQDWVLQGLAYQLRELGQVDAGPHTMTRTRLVAKLLADARGGSASQRDDALRLLWVLGERASLAALGDTAHLSEPSP